MGAGAGSQIANAIVNSGIAGNAAPKVQHMMHSKISQIPREVAVPIPQVPYEPMPYMMDAQPITSQLTVGDLLGIKPGSVEEVGGPGSFRNLNVPLR